MFLSNVFDSKIVDHEAEGNGTGFVREEAGSVRRLDVAIFLEVDRWRGFRLGGEGTCRC
jgi:hypothetical protein